LKEENGDLINASEYRCVFEVFHADNSHASWRLNIAIDDAGRGKRSSVVDRYQHAHTIDTEGTVFSGPLCRSLRLIQSSKAWRPVLQPCVSSGLLYVVLRRRMPRPRPGVGKKVIKSPASVNHHCKSCHPA
jgi:hypothetical protein